MPYRPNADWDRPVLKRQRDPFFTRIGLLIAGIALLIPVALIVRPTTDGGSRVETNGLPGAIAIVQPGVTASTVPVSSSVAPVVSVAPLAAVVVAESSVVDPTVSSLARVVEAAEATTTTVATTTEAPTTAAPTTATPTTVAATAPPTTRPPCGQKYEVQAGDFWSGIASAFDVSLKDLLAVNGANADTAIYPGDTVCLPVGARKATTTTEAPTTTEKPTTTTKAPKPTATTAAPATTVPSRSYSTAEIEQIIRDVWPDDLEERALQIAHRESTYRPTARNSCCYGLFQINWNSHKSWLGPLGITSASQLYDPVVNAQVALAVYQRAGGWGPWGG